MVQSGYEKNVRKLSKFDVKIILTAFTKQCQKYHIQKFQTDQTGNLLTTQSSLTAICYNS